MPNPIATAAANAPALSSPALEQPALIARAADVVADPFLSANSPVFKAGKPDLKLVSIKDPFNANSQISYDPHPRRILSLPGGGIQGVATLEVLGQMEEKTQRPIADQFDMIAGTSTGGVIALALAKNKHTGKPMMSARAMQDLYMQHGNDVFPEGGIRKLLSLNGLIAPKYDTKDLRHLYEKSFGDAKLSELETDVVITSVNKKTGELYVFSSSAARGDDAKTPAEKLAAKQNDYRLVDVALATSAVPGGFKSHKARNMAGVETTFQDGGLYKNNPVMVALSASIGHYGYGPKDIVSVDNGRLVNAPDQHQPRSDGLLPQASDLIGKLLKGQAQSDIALMNGMGPLIRYTEINPTMDAPLPGVPIPNINLDAAQRDNLLAVKARVDHSLKTDEKPDFDRAVEGASLYAPERRAIMTPAAPAPARG